MKLSRVQDYIEKNGQVHGLRKRPGTTVDNVHAWETASSYCVGFLDVLIAPQFLRGPGLQWACSVAAVVSP